MTEKKEGSNLTFLASVTPKLVATTSAANSVYSHDPSLDSFDRPESPTLPEDARRIPKPIVSIKRTNLPDPTAAAIELSISATVPSAPAAGMYWSRAITYGKYPTKPLRAHTANLIGESLYVLGGCDTKTCFNALHILDMDTLTWTRPNTTGHWPLPSRAHSCTTVERYHEGKRQLDLYVFGGGNGPDYFNALHVLNVDTLHWTQPKVEGEPPSPRRAHTTCLWQQKLIVVGGGDGARALADVHILDLTLMRWSKMATEGSGPIARGYHTGSLIRDKLVLYGGSDGTVCFGDVFVLDLLQAQWSRVQLDQIIPRMAHTTTQVGSYLFVAGGHDGHQYVNDLYLLNLVTMAWETRKVYGNPPCPRAYHVSVLYDSRLYVLGGYDGRNVFEDAYMLELSACAYLPQITNFDIDT
ncbi:hypothetical protein BY458DRAFT_517550 [Sporodiniella umbellata]|nr:hypothetical protein BY458DRAFT_517550 [Sporodiniella umbellata]